MFSSRTIKKFILYICINWRLQLSGTQVDQRAVFPKVNAVSILECEVRFATLKMVDFQPQNWDILHLLCCYKDIKGLGIEY